LQQAVEPRLPLYANDDEIGVPLAGSGEYGLGGIGIELDHDVV
jgi:hypothetical protein